MSATSDFYLARAEECATQAAATKLVNVRERFTRSEAAWREMADRILFVEASKNALAASRLAEAG